MKVRTTRYNAKRRLQAPGVALARQAHFAALSRKAQYGGNPEHKRNPGDFDLDPPASPRLGKTLCDDANIVSRKQALDLLRKGIELGLVSDRYEGEWPYNVWMVTQDGVPVEAQWEAEGRYHGYPMPESDPFRIAVLSRWKQLHD